jgi:hypothetical protein
MPFSFKKRSRLFVILIAVMALVGSGIIYLAGTTVNPAAAEFSAADEAQLPGNATCLVCHIQDGLTMQFLSGEVISAQISVDHFGASAHGSLSCTDCHTTTSTYPHQALTAQTSREYTLQYQTVCNDCHEDQANELADSSHTHMLAAGDQNAPICADCHNTHYDPMIAKDANGNLTPQAYADAALVCATCHSTIYDEYKDSVHGQGVIVEKNPDVPSCINCHGVHTISGPQSNGYAFRLSSPQLCADCHTNAQVMDKYGIATQVLDTYISDFHGTTLQLFEKTDPDQEVNYPVCYDCHGVHNISAVDDPQKGLEIKENVLVACQRCHPDATTNFPDAWLSHYIPSREHTPLVFYVNLFYQFFIPIVLGVMGVYVASDIYRRVFVNRRKEKTLGPESRSPEDVQRPMESALAQESDAGQPQDTAESQSESPSSPTDEDHLTGKEPSA